MKKRFGLVVLVIALAMPVGAQSLDFLVALMKAVVDEYGIETVVGVLEDIGYIAEGEFVTEEVTVISAELTVNHESWALPEEEMVDVLITRMKDPSDEDCWTYVDLGTSEYISAPDRMKYRALFINECARE